jgi:hypothetical protein
MALTDEALQLAALAAALNSGDCADAAQLTRAAATAAVREAGCTALMELAKTHVQRANHMAGAASAEVRDAVLALVSAMRVHPASVDVLLAGLHGLSWWCEASPHAKACAGAAGAVDAVVTALRVETAHASLQELGCRTLAALFAFFPANLRYAASAYAVDALLAAMRAHPSCAEVQLRACAALMHAAAECDGDALCDALANRDAAVALGAVELLTAALTGADADVSQYACLALANLAAKSQDGSVRAARCDASDAVLQSMRVHAEHNGVQTYGCLALGYFSRKPGAHVTPPVGAHAVIIRAMHRFPEDSGVQSNACHAMAALLPTAPTAHDDAKHAGAVACVVHALQAHAADAKTKQFGCISASTALAAGWS